MAPLPLLLSDAMKLQQKGVITVLGGRNPVLKAAEFVVCRIKTVGPRFVGEGRIGDSEVESL